MLQEGNTYLHSEFEEVVSTGRIIELENDNVKLHETINNMNKMVEDGNLNL